MRDYYLIYNNQGKSKGQAVVYFARGKDASLARQKYNGKVIDGRAYVADIMCCVKLTLV